MRPFQTMYWLGVWIFLLSMGCGASPVPQEERPPNWATPIPKPGLPNLHRISSTLYRGAQPSVQGFDELHQMGIKTIVNLRGHRTDNQEVKQAGLTGKFRLVSLPADAWDVSEEDVIRFLRVVAEPSNHPVFFHCKHGADRTGTMAAAHRVINEGWTKKDALNEMKQGGFGFQTVWMNLSKLVEEMDVARIKTAVSQK